MLPLWDIAVGSLAGKKVELATRMGSSCEIAADNETRRSQPTGSWLRSEGTPGPLWAEQRFSPASRAGHCTRQALEVTGRGVRERRDGRANGTQGDSLSRPPSKAAPTGQPLTICVALCAIASCAVVGVDGVAGDEPAATAAAALGVLLPFLLGVECPPVVTMLSARRTASARSDPERFLCSFFRCQIHATEEKATLCNGHYRQLVIDPIDTLLFSSRARSADFALTSHGQSAML